MGTAVVEERNTAEDGKNPAEEEVEKRLTEEGKMLAGQVQQFGGAEKTQVSADVEDPSIVCGAEHKHICWMFVEEGDDSKKAQLQKKKLMKRKRSELKQIKEEVLVDAGVPLRWCAPYYTLLLQRQTPRYKGSIVLDPELNRVALLDTNEMTVDCRYLKEGELIYPGLVLEFACHKAEIGKQSLEAKEDLPKKKRNKKDIMDEKKRCKLKRKRSDEIARELMRKNQQPLSSPQAKLVGSSIGMFARVAALRKRIPSSPRECY